MARPQELRTGRRQNVTVTFEGFPVAALDFYDDLDIVAS